MGGHVSISTLNALRPFVVASFARARGGLRRGQSSLIARAADLDAHDLTFALLSSIAQIRPVSPSDQGPYIVFRISSSSCSWSCYCIRTSHSFASLASMHCKRRRVFRSPPSRCELDAGPGTWPGDQIGAECVRSLATNTGARGEAQDSFS